MQNSSKKELLPWVAAAVIVAIVAVLAVMFAPDNDPESLPVPVNDSLPKETTSTTEPSEVALTPFSEAERMYETTVAALPDGEEVTFTLSPRCGPTDAVLDGVRIHTQHDVNDNTAVSVKETVERWKKMKVNVQETDRGLEANDLFNSWNVVRTVDADSGQVSVRANGEFKSPPEGTPQWLQVSENGFCG